MSNHTCQGQVIGIPISSLVGYKLPYQDQTQKNHIVSDPANDSSAANSNLKTGKKAESSFTNSILEHVTLGPKIRETVKGKVRLGAKILQVGGVEKILLKQLFRVDEDEKLLKASLCYLSTTAGPIAGLMFISSYKVMIPLTKIKGVNQSQNVKKPCQKYIEIVTVDGFEFWFMGFLNYEKAFRHLEQAKQSFKASAAMN